MGRTVIAAGVVFSGASELLVDCAIKGTALLILAAVAAFMLRRDSAATRHLVWLSAMVALLAVPILSALLPQWRVLPGWASISAVTGGVATEPVAVAMPVVDPADVVLNDVPDTVETPSVSADYAATLAGTPSPGAAAARADSSDDAVPEFVSDSAAWTWSWRTGLPLVWAIGFCALTLRLMVARWILWKIERQGTVIGSGVPGRVFQRDCVARQTAGGLQADCDGHDAIVNAFEEALLRLGLQRPVTLLIHPGGTSPVVWGILRSRASLPAAARDWSGEQIRSVLLHELAHIKRNDIIAQLLAQIACALYWFNPLVWIAAWRLGVERERACDDLVLRSGVRPSAYARHLLDVVTSLAPGRWSQSCGLAMARKSSLEGRLVAVLSDSRNRRGVSLAAAAMACATTAFIAGPVAMLRPADGTTDTPMQNELEPDAKASDESQRLQTGTKLAPGTEAQLDWGDSMNGLRAAIVIHSPGAGAQPGIYLVVQNVSREMIRFCDTAGAENLRKLYVSASGKILVAVTSGEPARVDVLLQPGEVAFLPMFPPVAADEESAVLALIEGLRKDSLQTWRGVLEMEKAMEGAWQGKLTTAETRGAIGTDGPQPQSPEARALYKLWRNNARLNGDIPGGLISLLHDKVKEFIRNNTGDASGDPYAKKMAAVESRFAIAGDWKPADAVALLDAIAAVTAIPLQTAMDHFAERTLQHGQPLPAELANADWGNPLSGGLRMALLLGPRADAYHLGTELKARILLHNAGKQPVTFITRSFQQPGYKATLASGQDLKLDSTAWTTRGRAMAFRLEPGEYCETNTPGIGIGKRNQDNDDWSSVRAGSWILCEAGDEVTLIPGPAMLTADGRPGASDWWQQFIAERVDRESPVPQDAEEREYLLYRVVRDLFGTAPSVEHGESFGSDKSPDALSNLARLLSKREYLVPCDGPVRAGATTFRVLPPDLDAARRPRVAKHPGRYKLGENVGLAVTRRAAGARIVNEGSVTYYPPGAESIPYDLKLPDGYDTWAAGWVRGTTELWVQQAGMVRKIDFTDPAKVNESRYESDEAAAAPIPADLREALRAALAVSPNLVKTGPPAAQKPAPDPPPPPAASLQKNPPSVPSSSPPKRPDRTPGDELKDRDGTLTDVPARESRIPLHASLLIVSRDWSNRDGKQVQDAIRRTLAELDGTPISREVAKRLSDAGSIGPDDLVSSDGFPSIFRPGDFADLQSWLRAYGLLLGELPIEQQAEPRTEERWKTWFDLSAARVPGVAGKWWLVADVRPAFTRPDEAGVWRVVDHPYYLADIGVSRTQQVMTRTPGGPSLRGASIGKTQQFGFYLPKNRVVVMDWDAPYRVAASQGAPDGAKVLLVIKDAKMPEQRSASSSFSLPERMGSLYLADEGRWLSPPDPMPRSR